MTFQLFLFLLVVCLLLASFAALASFFAPSSAFPFTSRQETARAAPSAASPRTPLDCPICRLCSSGVRPASAEVAPLV
jgi:hypothetical protein